MRIVLLGLDLANPNLGCQALAYSFVEVVEKAAKENNISCDYFALVFYHLDSIKIGNSQIKIDCKMMKYKSFEFWRSIKKEFKNSDLIVDFTGGDSFSDIYGNKRFRFATLIKYLAIKSKTPLLLGPQTYGPFKSKLNRKFATYIIKKAKWVFARDFTSANLIKELSDRDADVALDVAFGLPYEKKDIEKTEKINVGINVSGFLWEGGYFHLNNITKVNYQEYCFHILDYLLSQGNYKVYLIPHVGTKDAIGGENDLAASLTLHEKYPDTIVVKDIRTPIDAKNIISAMDLFIGARMHATIAALSSGVATIPFSYSRKFEGLFGDINYPYLVSGTSETTENAINLTIKWIENINELKNSVKKSLEIVQEQRDNFLNKISQILNEINTQQ